MVHEPFLHGEGRELLPVAQPELVEDVAQMHLGGHLLTGLAPAERGVMPAVVNDAAVAALGLTPLTVCQSRLGIIGRIQRRQERRAGVGPTT